MPGPFFFGRKSSTASSKRSSVSSYKDTELGDYEFYPDPVSREGSLVKLNGFGGAGGAGNNAAGRSSNAQQQPQRSSPTSAQSPDIPYNQSLQSQQQSKYPPQISIPTSPSNDSDLTDADPPHSASYFAHKAVVEAETGIHKGPQALFNPVVRHQLSKVTVHRPWFLWLLTTAQLVALVYSLVLNQQTTGSIIMTQPQFNYMIGPAPGVLISMGARFVPCMRTEPNFNFTAEYLCPNGTVSAPASGICTLTDLCGFPSSPVVPTSEPNQWFRFFLPIVLHGGVLHFLFNMLFQVRTGFQMERDFGWWRMAAIYVLSGVGGFVFGANFAPESPSVGCSGALYGLMACLLLDLFQNWRLISHPYIELLKLGIQILISLLIGTLPYIDNFAHVGGFFSGLLAGLVFMPQVYFGKWDKWRKRGVFVVAVPVLAVVGWVLVKGFYERTDGRTGCRWCGYLNCLPGMPWCADKWGGSEPKP